MNTTDNRNPRRTILDRLRSQSVPHVALPNLNAGAWIEYADPVQQFTEMIKLVGGNCQCIDSVSSVAKHLGSFSQRLEAKRTYSAVEGIPGNVNLGDCHDPHELENLDFVVYEGALGVAENGAIWITDRDLRHRVVFFITQYLVLLVRRTNIVHTMHQAYAQIAPPRPGFGVFLSGPSKTADIEQSLVIGAHGCRELQVFVL